MDSLTAASAAKLAAQAELAKVEAIVADVQARLRSLQESLVLATNEKLAVEAEAERCNNKLELAKRLVNGLSSENERWAREIDVLRANELTLMGNVLLSSAFVSYIGAFDYQYRNELWRNVWIPDLRAREIPMSSDVDPLAQITDDGRTAQMMSEGLPADRISIENGAIISVSKRWPLVIDPQQQGIKWLRQRESKTKTGEPAPLQVIQLSQKNWVRTVVNAIQQGTVVIVENVGEDIDPTLDPVLARAVYRKGKTKFLRIGEDEVEYDSRFRLYLQTKLTNPVRCASAGAGRARARGGAAGGAR